MIAWVEGFDDVDAASLDAKWPGSTLAGGVTTDVGRSSIFVGNGRCLLMPTTQITLRSPELTPATEWVISAQIRMNAPVGFKLFSLMFGSIELMSLWVFSVDTTKWRLEARRGTDVIATTLPMLKSTTFRLVEFRVKVDDEDGEVELRVDQVRRMLRKKVITDLSGAGSANRVEVGLKLSGTGNAGDNAIDDLIVTNNVDSSESEKSGFMGNVRVLLSNPETDVSKEWDTSAGTNHADLVDDTALDEDTTYLTVDDQGFLDTFEFGKMAPRKVQGSIVAVWLEAYARGDGVGVAKLRITQTADENSPDTVVGPSLIGSADYRAVAGASERVMVDGVSYPWTVPVLDSTVFGLLSSY